MGSRIANTRSRSLRLAAIGVIAGVAVVSLPGVAMAIPATDEYTLDYPDAKGEKVAGAVAPKARPSQLTSETRDALAKSADGKLLATIATATEVGAPGEGGAEGLAARTALAVEAQATTGRPRSWARRQERPATHRSRSWSWPWPLSCSLGSWSGHGCVDRGSHPLRLARRLARVPCFGYKQSFGITQCSGNGS